MQNSNWVQKFALYFISILILLIYINYSIDFYGLYSNQSQRKFFQNERLSKYLYSFNYIPNNFNSLIVGSSVTSNIGINGISGYKFYNISIASGNISEEKILVENIFKRKKIKVILIAIHPYLTATSGRKTGFMVDKDYWGSLGSIPLFAEYTKGILSLAFNKPDIYGYDGANHHELNGNHADHKHDLQMQHPDVVKESKESQKIKNLSARSSDEIYVDSQAINDYEKLIQIAKESETIVIGFIPPPFCRLSK